MWILSRRFCYIVLVILMTGCGERRSLAPVTEVKWHPVSKYQTTHTVRRGETLYAISFRYETDYKRLATLNHLKPPYSLRVGQILRVQQGTSRVPRLPQRVVSSHRIQQKPQTSSNVIFSPIHLLASFRGWLWPARGRVVLTFNPNQGKKGINIACKKGERIRASSGGVVAYAGSGLNGYGNLIIIKHNNEYLTAYGNNARNLVSEGQQVKAGQEIAEAGVIDHKYWGVHFEIRKKGIPVNPLNYLQKG